MSETFCGKSCAACASREELNCPGCKAGPGRPFSGECDLAECCRSKGHEVCGTCGFQGSCGMLRSRERQIDYRKRKLEAKQREQERLAKQTPVLGKWLWVLFWLIVPATAAAMMGNNVLKAAPAVYLTGRILSNVCSAAYGAILLKLATEEDRYRTAGICGLICAAAGLLLLALSSGAEAPTWSLLLTLPTAVVSLVGEYNEYQAHAVVLAGVDHELSAKWTLLWKWYIGLMAAMLASVLLILMAPALGVIAVIVSGIGTIAAGVVKLIYLYRTANVFRAYSVDECTEAK